MEYREVLQRYLEELGISQAELARRIGRPRSTVNSLLKHRAKEPTLGTAKAIADALGISLEEMADRVYRDDEDEDL